LEIGQKQALGTPRFSEKAKAAPLILAAQCIETDITFSSSVAAKNSVELASKLYDEILKLREPTENDD